MTQLPAVIEPLPAEAKLIGTLLAVGSIALCAFFGKMQRKPASDVLPGSPSIPRRKVHYGAVVLTCLTVLAGVWIHPDQNPRAFVGIWTLAILLTFVLLGLGAIEGFVIGRRGARQRIALIHQQRSELQRGLPSHVRGSKPNPVETTIDDARSADR